MTWGKQTIPITLMTFNLRGIQTIRIRLTTVAQGLQSAGYSSTRKRYLTQL